MTLVKEEAKFKDFSLSAKDMKFLSSKMGMAPVKAKLQLSRKQKHV